MLLSVTLVSGNKYKIEATKKILSKFGIGVSSVNLQVPEMQADSTEDVAKFSVRFAADFLNKPVIKADAGLFIETLGGFPGVYTEYVRRTLGAEGVIKLLTGIKNRRAKIVYTLAYCEPKKEPVVFVSGSSGNISTEPRGKEGMLIDFIFIPDGSSGLTMGELKESNPDKRQKFWGDAEEQFARWFLSKNEFN